MKIKISDHDHNFTYDHESKNTEIIQNKNTKNYCKIWETKKFINPVTKSIKYLLESEENVPMYGDTTIHKLGEFIVTDEGIDFDSLYVEKNLKVDIINDAL
ncbi:hypothetical protein J2Z42_000777 [Clostridium algifaecis]|uniref:Uncharacterized protein n=1 Tax=Clostridium algifaecis TaxID=1472040 RepID=A0ABS4KPZ6_9CLOT|nr:hypothetical protein [Clostridium algifaecis]MBP2032112.1 hypothetical protein [Clostridium algifaecis]